VTPENIEEFELNSRGWEGSDMYWGSSEERKVTCEVGFGESNALA